MQKFARDVGINVLANVVAGAIIYLIGVWTGLWDNVYQLTAISFALLVVLTFGGTYVGYKRSTGTRKIVWAVYGMWTALIATGFANGIYAAQLIWGAFEWSVAGNLAATTATTAALALTVRSLSSRLQAERATEVAADEWVPDERAYL